MITERDLKTYQTKAAGDLAAMIQAYPGTKGSRYAAKYDEDGELLPFLCRVKAITGSGKTPILAVAAKQLGNAIILWTTNRGAIISQTRANLSAGGKYSELLPRNTSVYELGAMSDQDWTETILQESGLTIILSTVAAYNQDPETDKLRIHRSGNWDKLAGRGEEKRRRPLYVFYDEGHGATKQQFSRLRDLDPQAYVLASHNDLPEDLAPLLGGSENREKILQDRTAHVDTRDVVAAGLLKTRLYLADCNLGLSDALREANDQWAGLYTKFAHLNYPEPPIACFIVNSTERGVDVWEELVGLGVAKDKIAVHLTGAEAVMQERRGDRNGLIDTYKTKKDPEQLKSEGYTHLIWNLTLREGWDEPMAYVAYIDDKGKSVTDMTQKIGRFVRQPNGEAFNDPDLNSAYFYFNVPDAEFESLIVGLEKEMTISGYEVIKLKAGERIKSSREVPAKEEKTVPCFGPTFGSNLKRLDSIILDAVPFWDESVRSAKGHVDLRQIDMLTLKEDAAARRTEERTSNADTTAYDYLMGRLQSADKRITEGTNNRFSAALSEHAKMKQRLQFGSEALSQLAACVSNIVAELNEEFQLGSLGRNGLYVVKPFNLVSPDLQSGTDVAREKYRVYTYNNALHNEYNGMNPFEIAVAAALDSTGLSWCRNPVKTGYGIPVPDLGTENQNFYPDFLLWTEREVWAIDPKGDHLKEAAAQTKLFDLPGTGGNLPVRVALILEGKTYYNRNADTYTTDKKATGYTLLRRSGTRITSQQYNNLSDLISALING